MTVPTSLNRADSVPQCSSCGSTNVLRDAWAQWDRELGEWVLGAIFDHAVCDDCGDETQIVLLGGMPPDAEAGAR